MYKISLSFKYEGKQYSFEFDNRVNIVTGLSATGKSFIQQSTTGIHLVNGASTQIYYVDGQPEQQSVLQMLDPRQSAIIILDESGLIKLSKQKMLRNVLSRDKWMFVCIIRNLYALGVFPISPNQIYRLQVDNGNTSAVKYYTDIQVDCTRHRYISEDHNSGNSIWKKALDYDVEPGNGIVGTLQKLLTDSTLMGCVDTLSLTSCMGLFESLRLQGTVPFFNVPSAEYLVAQTITPVENLNRLIYAEYNPEVACEKYLRRMLPRYTKSSKTVLNCAECKQSECIGKQINIVQGMRTYLKQIHPEYTFPWETETQRTNLFRCHDAL